MLDQSTQLELNTKGYLITFDAWHKDVARPMAKEHDLDLTECQGRVINFFRDYQAEYGIAPDPREIIKKLSKEISPATPCTKERLNGLFGAGGCELACKIAGLQDCHCRGA